MRDFISGNELSDSEIVEWSEHGIVQRADGSLWQTWRIDADGTPWLRSVDSIHAAAASEYDTYPDSPADTDDDPNNPIEFTMIYDTDGDDE